MGNLVFQATLGGQVNLVGPNTASTFNLNVPAVAGTLVTTGDTGTVTNTMCATSVYTAPGTIGSGTPNTGAFTTLSATGVASFAAGSAAAPAITRTGDTDTGIFFPAANTLAFSTNGTEDARFDASGNFGLGVTPAAWGAGSSVLQNPGGAFWNFGTGSLNVSCNNYFDGSNYRYRVNGNSSYYNQSSGIHSWYTAASGTAGNPITFTQAMTLDASGNLGVGTTTPLRKLTSGGTSGELVLLGTGADGVEDALIGRISSQTRTSGSASTSSFASIEFRTGGFPWYSTGNIRFLTNSGDGTSGAGTERARIDSSGNLLVGTTSTISSAVFQVKSRSGTASMAAQVFNNGDNAVNWYNGSGTYVSSIVVNSGTVVYGTVSDYRKKENVQPMTGALSAVAKLKPCTYTWKTDGSAGQGFIAHELAEVIPDAVAGEKDAVYEDGTPKYQSVDTSFVVATLTAAIQEQQALIVGLREELDAVKTKVGA